MNLYTGAIGETLVRVVHLPSECGGKAAAAGKNAAAALDSPTTKGANLPWNLP